MILRPINKSLEEFDRPIPCIRKMIRALAEINYYTEINLSKALNQLRISDDELSDVFTLSTFFCKISNTVMMHYWWRSAVCLRDIPIYYM